MPGLRSLPANGSFIQSDTLRFRRVGKVELLLQINDQINFFCSRQVVLHRAAAALAAASAADAATANAPDAAVAAAATAADAALYFQIARNTAGTFLMLNCTSMSQLRVS